MALQHLRSSTANKRPLPAGMSDGQLAINTESTSPGLFFKNSGGNLVKVGPVHVGTTAPNASAAAGGQSGNSTGELWLDTSLTPNELKTWDGSAWVSATGQEIPVSKLIDGSARQLLQTDAAGTGVEWTSNVDVPGTLDVTSTATFDGRIYTTSGSAGTPAISPSSDTDSGISFSGSGGVALNSNSTSVLTVDATSATADVSIVGTLDATGVSSFHIGTAAEPGITFNSDKNTGIYSPGADQLAISTNGTGRLFIDANGNVGVGTAPSTSFHVNGDARFGPANASDCGIEIGAGATGNRAVFIDLTGDTTYTDYGLRIRRGNDGANAGSFLNHRGTGELKLNVIDAGSITCSTNSLERLRITSDGKLGLGTSSPARLLTVEGSGIPVEVNSTNDNAYKIEFSDSGVTRGYIGARNGGAFVVASSAASELLRVTESGNVGIGTTSPAGPLEVAVAANRNLLVTGVDNDYTRIGGIQGGTSNNRNLNLTGENLFFSTGSSSGTSFTERARIDSSGRLLVGTPTSIGGTVSIAGGGLYLSANDSNAEMQLTRASANSGSPFYYFNKARGTYASPTVVSSGDICGTINFRGHDGSGYIVGASVSAAVDGTPAGPTPGPVSMPGRLVFSTTADGASSPTERMRVSQDGSVDIGPNNGTQPSSTVRGFRVKSDSHTLISRSVNDAGVVVNVWGTLGEARIKGDGDLENTNNSYAGLSDIKLKENIVDAGSQWDDLKALQVRKYNFKAETGYNTHTQIGLVAQEVELVSPGLVGESIDEETGESTKSVNYSVLYMKAVKALQEAMERIEVLEAKVNTLEGN